MAQKLIDLSGKKGLANRFQGNLNDIVAAPQRIYLGEDGQFADGIFNPLKNYGYLSPANNKFAALTGSLNSRIISTEYDSINDDVYLAENGNTIWRLDGLTDTSLTAAVTVDQSATEVLTDLEIYELNGKRNLFYAYNITDGASYFSKIGILNLDTNSGIYQLNKIEEDNTTFIDSIVASGTYQKLAQSVKPEGTTSVLTGSINVTASASVTGVGTLFTTELAVGDLINVDGQIRAVTVITNDTSLTVDVAFYDGANDTSPEKTTSLKFDKVLVPLSRTSGDNGGYTLQVSVQGDTFYNNTASMEFDGVDDHLLITDAAQTGLDLSADFSIECWVRSDVMDGALVAKYRAASAANCSYLFFLNPTNIGLTLGYAAGSTTAYTSDFDWELGTWYHVAVTRNGTTGAIIFYINGEAQTTISGVTDALNNTTTNFILGAEMTGSNTATTVGNMTNFYTGQMDDVRVWSDIRTAAEIKANMKKQLVGNESNLVGYWQLNYNYEDMTADNNDLTTNADEEPTINLDIPPGDPDGSAVASGTFNPTTVSTTIFGSSEKQSFIYVTLSGTVAKSKRFHIVLEPTSFAAMTATDNVNWFGRTSNPDPLGQASHYDGTYWSNTAVGEDFDYALILSSDQEWSNKRVANPYQFAYNADIFMCRADNGFMYVFEDNKVHKVDGTETGGVSGTFTKEVLRFPSYFVTVDAVDTRGRMYIAVQANPSSGDEDVRTYSEGIVGVYTWDRQSAVVGTRDFVPLYGIRDIKKLYIDPLSGDVRAICIGDDRFVQIRSISSGYGKIIQTLGISAYHETRDGAKVINGMVNWLGADGIFYLHGKLTPTDTEQLYKFGSIAAEPTGAFTTGAIFVGNSESTQSRQAILASFTDTVTSKLMKWYPHGQGTISSVAQTGNQGDVYTPVIPLHAMSTVKNITINNFPTASSAGTTIATVKIYFNQSTTPFKSHTVTQALASKGYVSIECNKPFVNSVQIEIEYSTSQTLGTDDFNPMFAIVEYEPPADVVK